MYSCLLVAHSFCRWLVLAALFLSVARSFYGWRSGSAFTVADNGMRRWTAAVVHVQLVLGLVLYGVSPLVRYFYEYFKEAVHERELRFFGMEHITVMLLAAAVITIGSLKAKRQLSGTGKFRTMAVWFGIGLLLILSSIPWSFSPLTSRPSFRVFWS